MDFMRMGGHKQKSRRCIESSSDFYRSKYCGYDLLNASAPPTISRISFVIAA